MDVSLKDTSAMESILQWLEDEAGRGIGKSGWAGKKISQRKGEAIFGQGCLQTLYSTFLSFFFTIAILFSPTRISQFYVLYPKGSF